MTATRTANIHDQDGASPTDRPWPGPRPFRSDESDWLFGRDRHVREIVQRLRSFRVVVLHAKSGVGKSSLLNAGVLPELQESGRTCIPCAWGYGGGGDENEFYARALLQGLKAQGLLDGLGVTLDEAHPEDTIRQTLTTLTERGLRPVLVFDQVEEIMRRDEDLARRFLGVVGGVATDFNRISQVLSLRSEYVFQTWQLEKLLGPLKLLDSFELPPLRRQEIVKVIAEPARKWGLALEQGHDPGTNEPDSVAETLVRWWELARDLQRKTNERKSSDPLSERERAQVQALGGSNVGLLHLQGVLDALFQYWVDQGKPPSGVTFELLHEFSGIRLDYEPDQPGDPLAAAFLVTESLRRYVRRTLASTDGGTGTAVGGPSVLEFQERLVSFVGAHMAELLSSGGYKVPREIGELANDGIADALGPLASDVSRGIVADAVKELLETGDARAAGRGNPLLAIDIREGSVDTPDAGQVAGPARRLRLSRPQVFSAAVRAAASAIERMVSGAILKPAPTTGQEVIYELVHDGFGPALVAWSHERLQGPTKWTESPTAVLGVDIVWESDEAKDVAGTIELVRWVGCWMGSADPNSPWHLSDITFRRSELRGTVFEGIDFQNVEFEDCDLNGALFRNCRMKDVRFAWTSDRTVKRDYDMMAFFDINDRHTKGPSVTFSNVKLKNLSIEHCFGLWQIERSKLFQVALSGSGLARIECMNSTLLQWMVENRWGGEIGLFDSDLNLSTIAADSQVEVVNRGKMRLGDMNIIGAAQLHEDVALRPTDER